MRIHRNQATFSEIMGAFACVAILIGIIPLFDTLFGDYPLAWLVDGMATYLLSIFVLPTWTVFHLRFLGRKQAAADYAGRVATHHWFLDQRAECAIKAATISLELGQKPQAEAYADQGLALTEKFLDRPLIRTYYAMCLDIKATLALEAHQYQKAFLLFYQPLRMKLELPGQIAIFYKNCAWASYKLGNFEEAVSYAEQALALVDHDQVEVRAAAHSLKALSLIEIGRFEEALAETTLALAIPASPSLRLTTCIYRVWAMWLDRQTDEAEKLLATLEPALKLGDSFIYEELREVRGRICLDKGQLNKAEEELREALGGAKANPAALYLLRQVAQRRGETSAVQAWREQLLHRAPESFYAQRVRDEQTPVV